MWPLSVQRWNANPNPNLTLTLTLTLILSLTLTLTLTLTFTQFLQIRAIFTHKGLTYVFISDLVQALAG